MLKHLYVIMYFMGDPVVVYGPLDQFILPSGKVVDANACSELADFTEKVMKDAVVKKEDGFTVWKDKELHIEDVSVECVFTEKPPKPQW